MHIDFDVNKWTGRDFRDYRTAVGEDVLVSMDAISKSEETGNIPTDAVYGIAWIALRREAPGLTFDEVLDTYTFGDLSEAMQEAANPTPARKSRAKA